MKLSERDFAAKMAVHRGKMCPLPKRSVRYVLAPVLAGHPSAAMSKGTVGGELVGPRKE